MHARSRVLPAALAGLLLAGAAQAAEPATLIYAGRVFDSEGGRMLGPRLILVQDGRIAEIGSAIAVPPGTRRIDLRAYTVLPGLVESHAHLLAGGATADEALRALRGAAHARSYLEAGYTSVRDLGKAGRYADVALKRAIEEGSVPGPRLFVSGPALAHGGAFGEERIVNGAEDARAAVREHARQGVDLIRIDAGGADGADGQAMLSLPEMQAAVAEAHAAKLKVTAYATGDAAIARALEAGVDAIEHGAAASSETLHRMRQEAVPMVPLQPFGERLKQAQAAGVVLAAGSDTRAQPERGEAARRALLAWREAGLAPGAILQAATIHGARLLGVPGLGVLDAGAHADIIAVQGDPLVDLDALNRLVFVMKAGQLVRAPQR